jgi:hypothetical protein
MIRRIAAIAAVSLLTLVGANAQAHEGSTASKKAVHKHMGLVNVYLDQAIDNTKYLSSLADMTPTSADRPVIAEAQKNLDTAIDNALSHIKQARAVKDASSMEKAVKGEDTANKDMANKDPAAQKGTWEEKKVKLDALEKHLREAKMASRTLRTAKLDALSTAVDPVSSSLMAARTEFTDLAKMAQMTLLEDMQLGTVPVRGTDEDATTDEDQKMEPAPLPPAPAPAPPTTPSEPAPLSPTPPPVD